MLEIYSKEARNDVFSDIITVLLQMIEHDMSDYRKRYLECVSFIWWTILQVLKILFTHTKWFTRIIYFNFKMGTNPSVVWQYVLLSRTWGNLYSHTVQVGVEMDRSLRQVIWQYLYRIANSYMLSQRNSSFEKLWLNLFVCIFVHTCIQRYLLCHCL